MIAKIVYILCAMGSIACAVLLIRGYFGKRTRLLLWSSLCFALLALNNTLLFVDMVVFPEVDLLGGLCRNLLGAVSGTLLLWGLIWELT